MYILLARLSVLADCLIHRHLWELVDNYRLLQFHVVRTYMPLDAYWWYKMYCIAWNINGIMNLVVWEFSKNRPNLIPHQYLDHYWIKCTHYTLYYFGINRYVYVVAVDTASPAKVSTEGRTCAEVLHILSKGDETGEGCTKWLFASKLGMKRNLQCLQWLYPWEQDNGRNIQYQKVPAKAGAQKSKTTVKRLTLSMPVAFLWRHQLMGLEVRQI